MQTDFVKGLLDPERTPPEGVVGPNGRPAGKRYDVYRNNVIVSLSEALASAFPVIQTLVGAEFFSAMANVHVRQFPPRSPLMIHYGEDFPDFLASFPPVAHLAYLPDIARLERARRMAYHAADADVFDPAKLEGLSEESHLILHPSVHVITSVHPIFSIWRFNSADDKSPLPDHGETVLISRPADELQMHVISSSAGIFLSALDGTLGEALAKATEADAAFDFTENLTALLSANLLIDVT